MKLLAAAYLALNLFSAVPVAHADDEDTPDSAPVEIGTALRVDRVRLTYYVESGVTYSGEHTYPGSAACSWNYPSGTVFTFRDGEQVRCNDRGMLGWSGWVDAFRNAGLAAKYGPWTTVQVVVP